MHTYSDQLKCQYFEFKFYLFLFNDISFLQWVYILDIVHQVLGWCGLNAVDPALTAEVVLRLALVFEASAALDDKTPKSPKGPKNESAPQDVDAVSLITSAKGTHRYRFYICILVICKVRFIIEGRYAVNFCTLFLSFIEASFLLACATFELRTAVLLKLLMCSLLIKESTVSFNFLCCTFLNRFAITSWISANIRKCHQRKRNG